VIILTTVMAYFKIMDGNVAMVFTAGIGSYNVMQGWLDKGKSE
jgi:acetate kinase